MEAALIQGLICNLNADVNLDGEIDPLDATLILQFIAGFFPNLPPV